MDRARASVIGVVLTAVLASGLLWLVPGTTRQVEGRDDGAKTYVITSDEADGQVKAAMDALEAGINAGNLDLALVGFATDDAEWLAAQRQLVTGIIEKLQGHKAQLRYHHPSWSGHFAGGHEIVSRRVYYGPTLVVDTVTAQVVGEIERYAIAPEGRFQLHRFPDDARLRRGYQNSLGSFYNELGQSDKAFQIWGDIVADMPAEGDRTGYVLVFQNMAKAHLEAGDPAAAYAAYDEALKAQQTQTSGVSYGRVEIDAEPLQVLKVEELQLHLAETAVAMGDTVQARQWYELLQDSGTQQLADLASARLRAL